MARRTILRRGLVEENGLRCHDLRQFVAVGAAYILVRPTQWKLRPLFVIEQGRLPFHAGMAFNAAGDAVFGELLSVDVFMTLLALLGSGLEVDVDQLGFEVRRFVAIDARGRAVRASELKVRLRVIEGRQLFPRFGGVAGLAACRRTVGTLLLHALFELALVRIGVTAGTVQVFPVIDRRRLGLEFRRLFVAIRAGSRHVTSGENEARLLVLGDAERGGLVALESVAAIAGVEIGRGNELSGMPVSMAIRAVLEFHLEQRLFALGNMTLGTLDSRVASLQRVGAGRVFFHRE